MDLLVVNDFIKELVLSQYAGLIPFVLIFLLFYFVVLGPQSKKIREKQEALNAIKIGDRILTVGGIIGKVVDFGGTSSMPEIILESGRFGAEIIILKSSVANILPSDGDEKVE